MGALGVAPHVVEAALNHLMPKLQRRYNKNKYLEERKAALDLWAAHINLIVAQATGANVTPLRARE